jgi:hypothetical protein
MPSDPVASTTLLTVHQPVLLIDFAGFVMSGIDSGRVYFKLMAVFAGPV